MTIDLEALGFTQEELQEKVIDKICKSILTEYEYSPEDGDWFEDSRVAKKLKAHIKERVDVAIERIAMQHIYPNVDTLIENVTLQKTTKWGESVGDPMTFKEYLTQRANQYLVEEVDMSGNAKSKGSFSGGKSQTRITYLIDQHLGLSIQSALKSALANLEEKLTGGIQGTIKLQLEELAKTIKIVVKP